jgi:uncharacterized protein YlxP (DUF503 family)
MFVGSVRVQLLIRESRSLKDKRQVVRSIMDRLRNEFNVSVAEVDAQDQRQVVVLGIAQVAAEAQAVRTTLGKIVDALRAHPIAEFVRHELDV